MKTHKLPKRPGSRAGTRHPDPGKHRALELGAKSEHETGVKRERLIREAARKAD
jgi:hypothetical protein